MIVIGIIGILAASLYPSLKSYLARWRDTAKISEIKQLNTALISYHLDKSTYWVAWGGWRGGWEWHINYTDSTDYLKSLFTALQEKWYITGGIKQKTVSDIYSPPILSNTWWCAVSGSSQDLYMLYFNNTTGQYSISGYLENPKWADINNVLLSYNGIWVNGTCTRYGRNYAVGQN